MSQLRVSSSQATRDHGPPLEAEEPSGTASPQTSPAIADEAKAPSAATPSKATIFVVIALMVMLKL